MTATRKREELREAIADAYSLDSYERKAADGLLDAIEALERPRCPDCRETQVATAVRHRSMAEQMGMALGEIDVAVAASIRAKGLTSPKRQHVQLDGEGYQLRVQTDGKELSADAVETLRDMARAAYATVVTPLPRPDGLPEAEQAGEPYCDGCYSRLPAHVTFEDSMDGVPHLGCRNDGRWRRVPSAKGEQVVTGEPCHDVSPDGKHRCSFGKGHRVDYHCSYPYAWPVVPGALLSMPYDYTVVAAPPSESEGREDESTCFHGRDECEPCAFGPIGLIAAQPPTCIRCGKPAMGSESGGGCSPCYQRWLDGDNRGTTFQSWSKANPVAKAERAQRRTWQCGNCESTITTTGLLAKLDGDKWCTNCDQPMEEQKS